MAKAPIPAAVVAEEVEAAPAVTIVLNDANRELLANCKEGDVKWIQVAIGTHDDSVITGEVEDVDYSEDDEVVQDETGEAIPKAIGMIKGGSKGY